MGFAFGNLRRQLTMGGAFTSLKSTTICETVDVHSLEKLMRVLSSIRSITRVAISFACLLVLPTRVRAQTFVEFGGGWNYVVPKNSGSIYSSGYNLRASFGQQLSQHFSMRYDAFTTQFDGRTAISAPCPPNGCGGTIYDTKSEGIIGLAANVIATLDRRGIVYLIGGTGAYDVRAQSTTLLFGVSAGAGLSVPVGSRMRAVVEARWLGLLGSASGPTSLMPITIGFRY